MHGACLLCLLACFCFRMVAPPLFIGFGASRPSLSSFYLFLFPVLSPINSIQSRRWPYNTTSIPRKQILLLFCAADVSFPLPFPQKYSVESRSVLVPPLSPKMKCLVLFCFSAPSLSLSCLLHTHIHFDPIHPDRLLVKCSFVDDRRKGPPFNHRTDRGCGRHSINPTTQIQSYPFPQKGQRASSPAGRPFLALIEA